MSWAGFGHSVQVVGEVALHGEPMALVRWWGGAEVSFPVCPEREGGLVR
jgi:hypothetical protein